jgi:hypothetical protein
LVWLQNYFIGCIQTSMIWTWDFDKDGNSKSIRFSLTKNVDIVRLNTFTRVEDIKCLDGKWLQHLTSLQHFTILEAPKLESLPKAGKFPSSLKVLRVKQCPLLEESLRRKRGKEWRKVAHIPSILIDLEMITWVPHPSESLK